MGSLQVTKEMLTKIKNGDVKTQELIYESFKKFLYKQVHHWLRTTYSNNYSMKDELVSVVHLGYVKALNTFDPDKGYGFLTYLARIVNNELLMVNRKQKKIVQNVSVSLDQELIIDENGNSVTLGDTKGYIPEEFGDIEFIELLQKIKEFKPKDKYNVLFEFFNGAVTQKQLGEKLGVSQSYASRLRTRQIKQLQDHLNKHGLIEMRNEGMERKIYTKEQKQKALKLLGETDLKYTQIANQTGLSYFIVMDLNKKHSIRPLTGPNREPKESEVHTTHWSKEKIEEHLQGIGAGMESSKDIELNPIEVKEISDITNEVISDSESLTSQREDIKFIPIKDQSGETHLSIIRKNMSLASVKAEFATLIQALTVLGQDNLSIELSISSGGN